jgi:hypothetical protein
MKWRREHSLALGSLEILEGELVPIYEPGIRSRLEEDLKDLLMDLRISFLDLGDVQGNRRRLTQAIARTVFGWGAAGILYQSKLDGQLACALFESRARLIPAAEPKLLSETLPELDQVCREFGLDVESAVPKSLA